MAIYICRKCGSESRYWEPGGVCPHCSATALSRLTSERVAAELEAMAVLYGGEMPKDGTEFPQQGDLFKSRNAKG